MNKKIIIEDGLSLYNKTGVGQYTQNICNLLTEMGYDVCIKQKPFLEKLKNSFIKRILYILWLNFIFPFYTFFNDANIIIFTNTLTPFYRLPNKKYYPVLHDLWIYKYPETATKSQKLYVKFVISSIKKNFEKIITVSDTVKKEIIDFLHCSEDKVCIVYNYFSFGEVPIISQNEQEQLNILNKFGIESKKYILSVATLNKRKNIQMLIDAYNQINTKNKLVLVGASNNAKFNNTNNNIIFTGYISDDELKILYKYSLLYVFPSIYEGFGIPIIDAQSFGVPVLCSNIPVFREIAGNGAIYFNLSIKDITDSINATLSSDINFENIINNGFKNVKRFASEKIKTSLREIFNDNKD